MICRALAKLLSPELRALYMTMIIWSTSARSGIQWSCYVTTMKCQASAAYRQALGGLLVYTMHESFLAAKLSVLRMSA